MGFLHHLNLVSSFRIARRLHRRNSRISWGRIKTRARRVQIVQGCAQILQLSRPFVRRRYSENERYRLYFHRCCCHWPRSKPYFRLVGYYVVCQTSNSSGLSQSIDESFPLYNFIDIPFDFQSIVIVLSTHNIPYSFVELFTYYARYLLFFSHIYNWKLSGNPFTKYWQNLRGIVDFGQKGIEYWSLFHDFIVH